MWLLSGKVPGVISRYLEEVGCWDSVMPLRDGDSGDEGVSEEEGEEGNGADRFVDADGNFTEVANAMAPLVREVMSNRGGMKALEESWAGEISKAILIRSAKGGEDKLVTVAIDGVRREGGAKGDGREVRVFVHKEGHAIEGESSLQEIVEVGDSGMVGGVNGGVEGVEKEEGMHGGLAGLEAIGKGEAVIIESLRMLGALVEPREGDESVRGERVEEG